MPMSFASIDGTKTAHLPVTLLSYELTRRESSAWTLWTSTRWTPTPSRRRWRVRRLGYHHHAATYPTNDHFVIVLVFPDIAELDKSTRMWRLREGPDKSFVRRFPGLAKEIEL